MAGDPIDDFIDVAADDDNEDFDVVEEVGEVEEEAVDHTNRTLISELTASYRNRC